MANKRKDSAPVDEMRPRLFVIRDASDPAILRFTIAEEVAFFEVPLLRKAYDQDQKEEVVDPNGILQAGLERLFSHEFDKTMRVVGFPTKGDPFGGLRIFDSGRKS